MTDNRKANDVFHSDAGSALQQHQARINELAGNVPASAAGVPRENLDAFAAMMARDFGVVVPNETVPLPSAGRVYPTNSSLYGQSTIDIKSMTAKEEDILTSPAVLKKGTVITELIRSCIVDKNVNPSDLLIGDRNALMVAIRVTGYGSNYETEVVCSECGKKSETTFSLTELPIKSLDISPVTDGVNEFEFILPKTGIPVHFKFLTGRDEEEMTVTQERQRKLGVGGDNSVTLSLQHCLLSVKGVTDKGKLSSFVKMMPAMDSSALRAYIKDNEPGILMRQTRTCKFCDCVEEVAIPVGITFLWPNARK